jgi:phosphoglycerate dehydrogenase-like enzyme
MKLQPSHPVAGSEPLPGIRGKVLGILGLGDIGSQVARIGRAFAMDVIAWSENLTLEKANRDVRSVSKQELFRESDTRRIRLVLSSRTRGLVGKPGLELMKPDRLVNASRRPIVDEEALLDAARQRRIAGAVIDGLKSSRCRGKRFRS